MGLRLVGHPTELIAPAGLHCVCVSSQMEGGDAADGDEGQKRGRKLFPVTARVNEQAGLDGGVG